MMYHQILLMFKALNQYYRCIFKNIEHFTIEDLQSFLFNQKGFYITCIVILLLQY